MAHRIICISRACGSGGKVIGQKVASKLGIGFYDSNLLDMAKEHGGISSTSLDKADEKATNPFYFKPLYEGNENVEKERPATETLFQLQSAVIRQIASEEDCAVRISYLRSIRMRKCLVYLLLLRWNIVSSICRKFRRHPCLRQRPLSVRLIHSVRTITITLPNRNGVTNTPMTSC